MKASRVAWWEDGVAMPQGRMRAKQEDLPDDLITVNEAAAISRFSAYTIYTWIREGSLLAHHFGRNIRISKKDLAARGKKSA